MIYYVNLTEFYHLEKVIKSAIGLAQDTCHKVKNDPCEVSITQLQQQFNSVSRDEQELNAQRKTRSICDWCGTLQHYLIGTMDAKRAKQYADHINQIDNETILQHDLSANQSMLFQAFLKSNQMTIKTIEKNLNKIPSEIDTYETHLSVLNGNNELRLKAHSLIQIATASLTEYFQLFSQIRRSVSDAKNHKIPELIPLNQLAKDLKKVAATLKPDQRLPIDMIREDPLHVFKYAEIVSVFMEEMLITQITLPIAEREQYQMYKATPIPIETPNGRLIAKISHPYFLLNTDQTKFIPLSKQELAHGKMLSMAEALYRPTASIQLKYENVCVWKLLLESSLKSALSACNFTPLIKNDMILTVIDNESYFATMRTDTKIWKICDARQSTPYEIKGRVIITLNPGCAIKTTSYIIKPHKTQVFNNTQTVTPEISTNESSIKELHRLAETKTANFESPHHQQIFIHNDEEMKQMIQKSEFLAKAAKHEFNIEKLTYSSKSYTVIIAIIISIILIIIIILGSIAYFKFSLFKKSLNALEIITNTDPESTILNLIDTSDKHSPKMPKTPFPKKRSEKQSSSSSCDHTFNA